MNRWRGGGWEFTSPFNKVPHGVKRILLAFVPTISLLYNLPAVHWCIWLSCYLSFWILGLVLGWGSWFFVGRAEDSWSHNKDAFWVEPLCFLFYGAKWIPKNHNLTAEQYKEIKSRFNYIDSPTGKVRPLEWRIKMERTAMAIRGLGITIPPALILFAYFLLSKEVLFWQLIFICPVGYLMGFCYDIWFHLNVRKFPSWLSSSTNVGEFLTGGIVLSSGIYLTALLAITSFQ